MKKLSILLVILAVLSALILASCSGGGTPESGESGGTENSTPESGSGGGTENGDPESGEGGNGDTTVEKVTITFNTDGGDPIESLSIEKGKDMALPTPTKKGYSFDGWYVGNTLWDGKAVSASTTITAKWTLLEFEIEYLVENGKNSDANVSVYTVNDTIVLNAPTVIGEYYEFFGWYLVLENEKQPIEKIEAGTTGKLTLYAEIKYQPFELALKDDGTYEVVGLRDAYVTEGEIPAYLNGKAVTSIKEQAFYQNTRIEKIAFSDTIKTVGYESFAGCTKLKSLRMSSGIEDIGTSAFFDCPALEYNVYENISYLGNESNPYVALITTKDFMATECVINPNTRLISSSAFAVSMISKVTIPQSVKYLCFSAFSDCYLLSSITFEGDGLVSIGEYSFALCSSLTKIELPNGLETIKEGAFKFTGISSLVLPSTVKSIGKESFMGCSSLRFITLSDNLQMIGENVFDGINSNVSLNKKNAIGYIGSPSNPYMLAYRKVNATAQEAPTPFVIEEGTKFIHSRALNNCDVTEVILPNSVVFIGSRAYNECGNLSKVVLGEGVLYIGASAFANCDDLHYFTIQSPVREMGAWIFENSIYLYEIDLGNKIEAIGAQMLMGSIYIETITIPDSVKTIGQGAFLSCSSLKNVVIGNGVKEIPKDAFQNCTQLKEVVMGENVESIGEAAFSACSSLETISLGNNVKEIHSKAFASCPSLKAIKVGNGILYVDVLFNQFSSNIVFNEYGNALYLGNDEHPYLVLITTNNTEGEYSIHPETRYVMERAFHNCPVTKVTIPASVISMGKDTFLDCALLTEVVIESGLPSIPQSAFKNCILLESVALPSSLKTIGAESFYGCKALKSVLIPNSVKELGNDAFYYCSGLESLTIGSGLSVLPTNAFAGCSSLTSVKIPSTVKTIGEFAFSSCSKLASVTVENGVCEVLKGAFYDSGLTSIVLPETVTVLGERAFYYCFKLESASILGVKSIEKGMFYSCERLTSVAFNNELESIGNEAFCRSGITEINIPNTVKSIGVSAFEYCRSLTTVNLGTGVEFIGDFAFSRTGIVSIVLPESLVQTGNYLFSSSSVENIYIVAEEIPATWSQNWCGTITGTITTGYGKND